MISFTHVSDQIRFKENIVRNRITRSFPSGFLIVVQNHWKYIHLGTDVYVGQWPSS